VVNFAHNCVKRCAKHSWLTLTKDYVASTKREKLIYVLFAGVFIILDFGNSFSLTIHFQSSSQPGA